MQQRNLFLFLIVSLLILVGYSQLRLWLNGPPPHPQVASTAPSSPTSAKNAATKEEPGQELAKKGETSKGEANKGEANKEEARKETNRKPESKKAGPARENAETNPLPPPVPVTPLAQLIPLGSRERNSKFHLGVQLDPLGGGVHQVVLNKFQAANDQGRPVWRDRANKVPYPLELVTASANEQHPSHLLYHFNVNDPDADRPLDTLGRIPWKVVETKDGKTKQIVTDGEGRQTQRVSFRTEIQSVEITKTYTLTEREYHLGLEVKLRRVGGDNGDKPLKFRYQLTSGHGLPIEGKWYTSIFRNSLIAQVQGNSVWRDLQDLRQISIMEGGNDVRRDGNRILRYAGVAVQYFANVVVVDDDQPKQDFLSRARPTLQTAVIKGTVKSIASDFSSFVLTVGDKEQTFYVRPEERDNFNGKLMDKSLTVGMSVAVIGSSAPYNADLKYCPRIATSFGAADRVQPLWDDDISVRLMSEPVELKAGAEVVHKYLLYNGPVKVNLLGQMTDKPDVPEAVPTALVHRYVSNLNLNTLTDYQSPGPMGNFASTIFWTDLVVLCTNFMHAVLYFIHWAIPNYGLCIIVLTILVRGLMFPVSRKQALTTIKMQELGPELKKLHEKYKDDRQALGAAQMELYRRNQVNPFGTCWLLLLQMPIFMGLYFALQESIHFRLAEFWPTWIQNLAAPDMMLFWGRSIPWLSRPEDYGGFLYLGPYFNLLPIIAVTLMILQQKMMAPPAADEQQAAQQAMMKYMMIFFGLMFYKIAAGLCIYFIASSIWGFAERKLLPKRQLATVDGPAPSPLARLTRESGTERPSNTLTPGNAALRNRRRPERGRTGTFAKPAEDGSSVSGLRGWWRQRRERLQEWWKEVLRQAEKK